MSSGPDVPAVANPTTVASDQYGYNKAAGQASQAGSMVNQVNPYGSLNYMQSGTSPDGTPLYTSTTTLSPENQNLLKILQGTQATAGQQGQDLIKGANYGAQQPGDVIGNATSGLVKDAMAKQVAYLDPYFKSQTDQMDTKLKNQGLNPGEPGYDNAMRGVRNSQGNTVTGFESQMEPAMWNQAAQAYMMPAQLGGSLTGLGSPTMPTWNNTPNLNVQSPDLIGATNSAQTAQMAAYKAANDKNNAMMSGLFGVPTAVLGGWAQNGGLSSLMGSAALAAV